VLYKEKYIEGYRKWLEMMNYVQTSINYGPTRLTHFLDFMETQGVEEINQITGSKVQEFFEDLAKRKSQQTGEVLSLATLRNYLTTINRFARYLRQSGEGNIEVPVKFKGQHKPEIEVLTKLEIDRLYNACEGSLLGMRDRALLAVFYGCGVRRNEGAQLQVRDILPDKNLLYIRHGKGYRERYVPMVGQVKKDIINYATTARPIMSTRESKEHFFIGMTGRPLTKSGLYERYKKLKKKADITKPGGLHMLRHSIATHLLVSGMKLSEIAKFLGHRSLESTQIYTHLRDAL